jgi:hypothetical protein
MRSMEISHTAEVHGAGHTHSYHVRSFHNSKISSPDRLSRYHLKGYQIKIYHITTDQISTHEITLQEQKNGYYSHSIQRRMIVREIKNGKIFT